MPATLPDSLGLPLKGGVTKKDSAKFYYKGNLVAGPKGMETFSLRDIQGLKDHLSDRGPLTRDSMLGRGWAEWQTGWLQTLVDHLNHQGYLKIPLTPTR